MLIHCRLIAHLAIGNLIIPALMREVMAAQSRRIRLAHQIMEGVIVVICRGGPALHRGLGGHEGVPRP